VMTARCGETILLTIHNNTSANETTLSLGPLSLFKTNGKSVRTFGPV